MVSVAHFQIAIVGGGIAGITMALACEKLGINYALLEARESLESDRGAGIGLQPNGLRILDQLGVCDEIEQNTVPLHTWYSYDGKGNLIGKSSAMQHYRERIGYGVMFIDRYKLLRIMTDHLRGTGLIRKNSNVKSIDEKADHVVVTTADGFRLTADLVVGTDGVRSVVRQYIDSTSGGEDTSSSYMSASYATVYGVSAPTPGINEGERFALYREKETIIGFTGKEGIIFWFVFEHLEKSYTLAESPRYTTADGEALCNSVAHLQVTPCLRFADIYANRTTALKVAVEEGVATKWNTKRTVLAGDAAHKMTPAGGQGANQAIESIAVLVNHLMQATKGSREDARLDLKQSALSSALTSYSRERMRDTVRVISRSRLILEALFCFPGPSGAIVKQMLNLSDEEWLSKAFLALSETPYLLDIELTARGLLYKETAETTLKAMKLKMESEQKGL